MKNFRRLPQALGMATALLLATPLAAAADPVRTLHIEVNEDGEDDGGIRMQMPVALLQAMARSIDIDELSSQHLMHELEHEGIDIRKLWREIRDADIREFFTLESDEADVRAWRENGLFKMTVRADKGWHGKRQHDTTQVEISVPELLMDLLVEEEDVDPEAFLEALQDQGPMTLVNVQGEHGESVRIWID